MLIWILSILLVIYLIGVVIFKVRGSSFKLALIWPLYLMAMRFFGNVQ